MRHSALPFVLACLLGSTVFHPAAAGAAPDVAPDLYDGEDRDFDDDLAFDGDRADRGVYGDAFQRRFGPLARPGFRPLPVYPYGDPVAKTPLATQARPASSCNVGTVLTGAVLGGGLGAVLTSDSRNRRWALPMGAAAGGLLGGILAGC